MIDTFIFVVAVAAVAYIIYVTFSSKESTESKESKVDTTSDHSACDCGDNGVCVRLAGPPKCVCNRGWEGERCDTDVFASLCIEGCKTSDPNSWAYDKSNNTCCRCMATQVPNSDKSDTGSITGNTNAAVAVQCDGGYSGGGDWTCGADGNFSGTPCSANSPDPPRLNLHGRRGGHSR